NLLRARLENPECPAAPKSGSWGISAAGAASGTFSTEPGCSRPTLSPEFSRSPSIPTALRGPSTPSASSCGEASTPNHESHPQTRLPSSSEDMQAASPRLSGGGFRLLAPLAGVRGCPAGTYGNGPRVSPEASSALSCPTTVSFQNAPGDQKGGAGAALSVPSRRTRGGSWAS